jgi:transglutaminase-like putative cysteine protease
MRIRISHETTYAYASPAEGVIQVIRQTPQPCDTQRILDWRVDVDADGFLRQRRDAFGNVVHTFYAAGPVRTLTVRASGEAETFDMAGVITGAPEPLPVDIFLRETPLTRPSPAILDLVAPSRGQPALDGLHDLMQTLSGAMRFDTGASNVSTTAAEAFAQGSGVCQDYAHIFVAAARALDIPARYVSGHLARNDDQEAAHAWAEVYVSYLGWVGFDAVNNVCATEQHLRVAVGLDYLDTAPLRGARRGGGDESLDVLVRAADPGVVLAQQ